MFIITPLSPPDEQAHYESALQISNLVLSDDYHTIIDKAIDAKNIDVLARMTGDVNVAEGTATGGGVAVGANVIVAMMNGTNEAVVDAGSKTLNATENIRVQAGTVDNPSTCTVNAQSYVVAAGGATGAAKDFVQGQATFNTFSSKTLAIFEVASLTEMISISSMLLSVATCA